MLVTFEVSACIAMIYFAICKSSLLVTFMMHCRYEKTAFYFFLIWQYIKREKESYYISSVIDQPARVQLKKATGNRHCIHPWGWVPILVFSAISMSVAVKYGTIFCFAKSAIHFLPRFTKSLGI